MKTKNLIRPIKTGLATKAEKKKKLEDACIVLDEVTKVRVAPSQVHGVGLFAMRDIKKGEKLYTDALPQMFDVPYKMFKKLRPDVREHILGRWPNIINGSHFLSDGMLATYLNHSDTPNYDAKKDEDPDAYLCAVHIKEKNQIAKEIDAKFANRPKEKVMSDLELFDSQALQFTGPDGRKISFLDARPKHNG